MSEHTINKTAQRLCAVVLVVGVVCVYFQVADFRYAGTTDFEEVASNERVIGGLNAAGVEWVSEGTPGHRWQPMTWLVHMAVTSIDNQATLHHAINLVLHLLNVLLVFMLLERIAPAPISNALFAGLIAFHPMLAVSVAWVTALGEVLGASFLLLAMFSISDYVRGTKPAAALGLAVLLAAGAVLSSPRYALAPLAVPLFAMALRPSAIKPHRFIWFPFALIAAYGVTKVGIITYAMNGEWGRLASETIATIGGVAILLKQFLWPFGLTIYYPDRSLPLWLTLGSLVIVAAVTVAVLARRRAPMTAFGLAVFLLAVPPLVSRTATDSLQIPIAEAYLAVMGLVFAVAGLRAFEFIPRRAVPFAKFAGAVVVLVLAVSAALQTSHRANSFTVLRHNIAVCEECAMPYRLLGDLYAARQNGGAAIEFYEQAVSLDPDDPSHRLALVLAHWGEGDTTVAEREMDVLIEQHPDYQPGHRVADALFNR